MPYTSRTSADTHGMEHTHPEAAILDRPPALPAELVESACQLGRFSSEAFLATDTAGTIVYSNQKTTELFGWSSDDLIGTSIALLMPTRFRRQHEHHVASFASGADSERHIDPPELMAVDRHGREFPAAVALSRVDTDGATMLICTVRDITEQVEKAIELHANEQRLTRVFDAASVALWEEDFTDVASWLDELRDSGVRALREYLNERPALVDHGATLIRVRSVNKAGENLGGVIKGDDGTAGIAKSWITDSVRQALIAQFEAVWDGRLHVEAEMTGGSPGDTRQLILHWDANGRNGDVDLSTVIVSMTDITRRVEAERSLEVAESQLQQAQKLEAIGQLAAGVAHEINTPIQYVGDNARFLKDAFTETLSALRSVVAILSDVSQASEQPNQQITTVRNTLATVDHEFLAEEGPDAFEELLDGVERIATIVSALKKFSHPGRETKTMEDLNSIVADSIAVSRTEWKYHATISTDYGESLPAVACMRTEIGQVVINLIVNAAQELARQSEMGAITIKTYRADAAVVTEVADNGRGVPPEIRDRIFEPFFTTKEVGEGTGQGLALAHRVVVEQHGGSMLVADNDSGGATFAFSLPISPP